MSQNELDEVGDIETDVATDVENIEEDNTSSDDEQITWEEIHRLRKDSESLKKANKKIAMLEKGQKKVETETTDSMPKTEAEYEVWAERRDFYKANPSASDLRKKIEAMVSASEGSIDRSKAFDLLSGDSEVEENRKVYAKTALAGGKSDTVGFSPISVSQYDKLSDSQRNEYDSKSMKVKGFIDLK